MEEQVMWYNHKRVNVIANMVDHYPALFLFRFLYLPTPFLLSFSVSS